MGLTYTFRESDTGAPNTLTNAAGTLIGVFDAVLVNGYNSKTVTITRSGSTATANCTSHGYRTGQIIKHSGAGQSEYNIEARVTVTDANNYTFAVSGSPTTPATGTITAIVAPVGWTKAFSGTNLAVYRTKSGTNQFYLRVDDTGTTETRIVGYETMSDVNTGTGPFPTAAQVSGGLYFYKANAASARSWRAWSDGKMFHFSGHGSSATWTGSTTDGTGLSFGDFVSYKSGDAYNTLIASATSAAANGSGCTWGNTSQTANSASSGFYIARAASQASGAISASRMCGPQFSSGQIGSNGPAYPDPTTGGANVFPVYCADVSANSVRGKIQGIWGFYHSSNHTQGDTFSGGTGTPIEGRTFEQFSVNSSNSMRGCMETSDTWG